jgi:hypothetical protein
MGKDLARLEDDLLSEVKWALGIYLAHLGHVNGEQVPDDSEGAVKAFTDWMDRRHEKLVVNL